MTAPAASSSGDARLVAIPVAFGVIADIGQNAEIVASDLGCVKTQKLRSEEDSFSPIECY
jgi:hypothetical protein